MQNEEFEEDEIFKSMDRIENPTMIVRSKYEFKFHITHNQYLGNIKNQILDTIGKKIGAIRNNETDYDRVYNTILRDLKEGYLGKITFDQKYMLFFYCK